MVKGAMAEPAGNKDGTRQLGGLEVEEWAALAPPNQTKSTTESQDLDSRKKEHHQIQILRL